MYRRLQYRVYDVLVNTEDNELVDRIVATFLMILIFLNVVAVILETVDELAVRFQIQFLQFEYFSVAVFSIEYLLRLWIAPLNPKYRGRIKGRVRYALTPMAIIDFLAVLPAYLPFVLAVDLRLLRMLRLFRLFRLLKMARYAQSVNTLDDVIRSKKEELLVTAFMILMLLVFASSLLYVVEAEVQPDKFASIPAAMWWGVATLTTVGYGDIFPITPLGKLLAALIAIIGIGVFALPTGIIATGFTEEMQKKSRRSALCPHCGKDTLAPVEPEAVESNLKNT